MTDKTVINSGQVLRLTHKFSDGTAFISGVYQAPNMQGGATITGDGSLQHPYAVVLTPRQKQADNMYYALVRFNMGLTTKPQLLEGFETINGQINRDLEAVPPAPVTAPPSRENSLELHLLSLIAAVRRCRNLSTGEKIASKQEHDEANAHLDSVLERAMPR